MEKEGKKEKVKLKHKIPKTIGGAIDLLHGVRTARKALQAKAEAEKAQEDLIEATIFERFGKSELEGARGKLAQCSIKRSDVPTLKDFAKTWAWAKKNDAPDIFQRRISVEAWRERTAGGKTIPGVDVFTKVGLTLTKVK